MKKLVIFLMVITLCLSSCSQKTKKKAVTSAGTTSTSTTSKTTSGSKTSSQTTTTTSGSSKTSSSTKSNSQSSTTSPELSGVQDAADLIATKTEQLGMTQSMFTRSVVQEGNLDRIANAMKKAKRGEPITIGVIGGSITEGAKASDATKSYSGVVKNWWETAFPQSRITLVNAGIGSTGSLIGVHRIAEDLLSKNPDFVIVEFAVNDNSAPECKEAYENVVRRILSSSKNPGVLLLFTLQVTESGGNITATSEQAAEVLIGKHYNLPMVSYKDAILSDLNIKKLLWMNIAADKVHPNDTGHAMIGTLVNSFLQKALVKLDKLTAGASALPSPLVSNAFENALLLTNKNITPTSLGGFSKVTDAFYAFPNGWVVNNSTDPIVFQTNAKSLYLMYKKDVSGSGGKAVIKVDGAVVTTLDSDFSGGFGDNAVTYELLKGTTTASHTIEIQLQTDGTKNKFTILGLLQA